MKENERREFAEAMNQLFSLYGEDVTNRMRDAWWGILQPYHLKAVLAAMNLHASDITGNSPRGAFRPTPADIRRHLEVTIPTLIKAKQDQIARDARQRIAPLREQVSRAETDLRLGLITREVARSRIALASHAIREIMAEPEVIMALNFDPKLRDTEVVGPEDRTPENVRLALAWTPKTTH